MSNTAMCRVCLEVNVHMYVIFDSPYQEIFEKLTDIPLTPDSGKPLVACYICCSHLKRCRNLMERAINSDALLSQIISSGLVITQNSVTALQRESYNLIDGLCISPIENITAIEAVTINVKDDDTSSITRDLACNVTAVKDEVLIFGDTETNEYEHRADDFDENLAAEVDDKSPLESDSDDDIPLKNISKKKQIEKRVEKRKHARVRKKKFAEHNEKKEERGFTADFAREIILSRDEQLRELQQRAKSLNYLNSPLKCELCFKGFVDARAFGNHRAKHDEKSGPHVCDICRMRYRTARQLRTHVATSHGRQYACHKCAHRSHTANQAREHEKWHSGYTYECKLCGHKFRKPTSYLTHMRKRHPTQHVCNICGDSFVGRHGLLMHKSKAHHRDDEPPENPEEPAPERFCGECGIQFVTVDAWKRHILSSVRHTLGNENSLQCRICGELFSSATNLSAHMREHERALRASRAAPVPSKCEAELACEQCGAYFVNRSKLQAHVKRIHLGLKYNKNIVCELCGKKCASNASLRYHQRTHTGEKPYQCGTCAKRFADNNQLRIHTRTHTGERPYCCAECGKRFSQKPALNRHYRVHTGAKPYTCQLCSKTFSQSNSLKLHVRTVHLKMAPNRRSKTQNPAQEIIQNKLVEDTVSLQNL